MPFGKEHAFEKKMQVKVADQESNEKLHELCACDREIDRISSEKASASAEFNQQLKAERKRRTELLNTIETGIETRTVRVYERLNEQRQEVETVRFDDDVVLDEYTRPLSREERQLSFGDAGNAGDSEEADGEPGEADEDAPVSLAGRRNRRRAASSEEATAQ